ncbi:hypothetical protein N7528_003770 [Penicillium herquei]|nr:hypothetical protein N7528_003770 [Penicillium herquei]
MRFAPESASETATKVIEECKLVFEDILVVVERQEREAEQGLWQRATHMLTIAFRGHDLEKLKVNLERLKSTVILMLNVMMYAGQVRQNTPALKKIIEGLSRLLAKRKEDRETGIKKLQTMIDVDKANNASGN